MEPKRPRDLRFVTGIRSLGKKGKKNDPPISKHKSVWGKQDKSRGRRERAKENGNSLGGGGEDT